MFILYFIDAILSKKNVVENDGLGKKIKRGDDHIGGLPIEGGFKPSAHYGILRTFR